MEEEKVLVEYRKREIETVKVENNSLDGSGEVTEQDPEFLRNAIRSSIQGITKALG